MLWDMNNTEELMQKAPFEKLEKQIIVAICGKSASGKDTLAKGLAKHNTLKNYSHLIVSDTTRPPRDYEINDIDYHFITTNQFLSNIHHEKYLETTSFRGWYYGTNKKEICYPINIGVFNPAGMLQLLYNSNYIIIPVILKTGLITRLIRSYDREHKWKWEYIRRAWTDFKDFRYFEKTIREHSKEKPLVISTENFSKEQIIGLTAWRVYRNVPCLK